jgi:hypothetical protein
MGRELADAAGGDLLGCFIEHDPLDIVADVASVEDIADIRRRHDDKPADIVDEDNPLPFFAVKQRIEAARSAHSNEH